MAESGWVVILVDQVPVNFHHLVGLGSLVRGVALVLSAGRELTTEKGGLHSKMREDFRWSHHLIIHTCTEEQTMSLVILELWLETPEELLLVVMIGDKGGLEENCRGSSGLMNPDEDHQDLVKSFQIEFPLLHHIAGVHQKNLVDRETISGGMVGLDLILIQIGTINHRQRCMVSHHHQSGGIIMPGPHRKDPSLNPVVGHSFKLDLQDQISPFPESRIILLSKETGLQLLLHNKCKDHLSNSTRQIRELESLLILLSH